MSMKWTTALKPVQGTMTLLTLRWLLSFMAMLPGIMVAREGIGTAIANRPYFTEAGDRLPFVELIRLFGEIPGNVWGMFSVGVLLAWIGNLLLTAGAADIYNPNRQGAVSVWRTVFDTGSRAFFPFLRVTLLALPVAVIGTLILNKIFERMGEYGEIAGWTGKTLVFGLGLSKGFLIITLFSIIGVFALWSKVIIVADDRRYVRQLVPLVAKLWWRRPIEALLSHVILIFISLFVGAVVVAGWRQSTSGATSWIMLWLAVVFFQAFIWQWRIRAMRLVWAEVGNHDLQSTPDTAWGLFRWIKDRFRKPHKTVPLDQSS